MARAVEVFSLVNHPAAKTAFAWGYKNDAGKMRYVAVLKVPPINSPIDAVRASIVADAKAYENDRARRSQNTIR